MEVIKKSREEDSTLFTATQGVKGNPSLAVLGLAAEQLEALIQVTEKDHGSLGSDETVDNQGKDQPNISRSQFVQSDDSSKGKVEFNQKSVFNAAGEMSKLQTQSNSSLENELNNELAIMEAQLKAMQSIEQFWQKFGPAWEQFEKDPSDYSAFEQVMKSLEQEYGDNPSVKAFLEMIDQWGTYAHSDEDDWKGQSGWHHFWHGEPLSDPHYFENFAESWNSTLQSYAESAVGNPALFANALANGESTFQSKITQLTQSIQVLMQIVKILEGSGGNSQTAMFDMEALLMDLQQLQINTNTQKSQQQQQISSTVEKNMHEDLKKIKKAIKKANHHSGGLFGLIKHAFEGVFHALAAAFDGITGHESDAAKQIKKSGSDFKKVGEALFDLVKLLAQAVLALCEVLAAGLLSAGGDSKDAASLMKDAKKLGEDMLANPALKLVADIAMVAIIVASAISGQYWLAGIMVVLFVMSETGLMQKMTDAIANSIESDMGGKNSALAKVLADIIVIVIVTVLSAGAGAAEAAIATAGDTAAAVGEQESIEMVDMASSETEQNIDEEVSQTEDEASQSEPKGKAKGSRTSQIAKRAASMGAFGFGSTLGSSSLAIDILQATSKKDSEALAIILELVQAIVAAVTASIGGFTSMTQSVGNVAKTAESSAANLTQFASRMAVASTAVGAVAGAANGGEVIIQGKTQEKIKGYEASVTLDEATQNSTDAMIKQTGEELKQMIKGYEELIATAFKAPEEVANAELQELIQG